MTTKLSFSLSRVYKYFKDKNFGIVSAYLGGKSNQENKERQKKLKKEIRDLGYGYKEIRGVWRPDKESPVELEYGLFIPNAKKKDIVDLDKKFEQYAVIYKEDDKITLDCLGNEENKFFNNFEEGVKDSWLTWSEYRRHKFRYSSVEWGFPLPPEPNNFFKAMSLESYLKDSATIDFNYYKK